MYNDSVSAYALIKRYRTTDYALSNSGWTLLDSAEQVFKLSKERVYNAKGGKCWAYSSIYRLHIFICKKSSYLKSAFDMMKVVIERFLSIGN